MLRAHARHRKCQKGPQCTRCHQLLHFQERPCHDWIPKTIGFHGNPWLWAAPLMSIAATVFPPAMQKSLPAENTEQIHDRAKNRASARDQRGYRPLVSKRVSNSCAQGRPHSSAEFTQTPRERLGVASILLGGSKESVRNRHGGDLTTVHHVQLGARRVPRSPVGQRGPLSLGRV